MTQAQAPGPHPDLPVAEVAKAEARSRADGPWSVEHLRLCWIALVGVTIPATVVVGLVADSRALYGVLLGAFIVGAFFTVSTMLVAWIGRRMPQMALAAALGAYLMKIVILGVVIVTLPRSGPIDPRWMAIAVVVGLLVWLAAHMRYIWTAKVFYVDPTAQ